VTETAAASFHHASEMLWFFSEFTADVWLLLAITLPMTLVGIYLGNRIFAELDEATFRRLVSLTPMVSGFALLLK
jgi:uncharacterized membrane protein YfcA